MSGKALDGSKGRDCAMNVFVYGTLMKGYGNHRLVENETWLGDALLKDFGLYNVTQYYPGIIKQRGSSVRGEVYDVSEKTLEKLDILEGEGSLYLRIAVKVTLNTGKEVESYVYVWNIRVREHTYMPVEQLPWRPGVVNRAINE
jgi:gamma-glutamylaminecyclotransferase